MSRGHGHAGRRRKSRTYYSWEAMMARCYNPNHVAYPYYGGRGIGVHFLWQSPGGFVEFLRDMGERPEGCTLGRIDEEADYGPDNCRWETTAEQNHMLRDQSGQRVTIDGRTQTLAQWAEELGIRYRTLQRRIQRGWGKQAFRIPAGARRRPEREECRVA